ncbi:hypothetical protein CN202_01795 [Sinorhizobium meliloti]|uniref:hypothetical protein n=1 Tax=Rhizobium meliloti TaxID=382 RepID=UPI000FDA5666|nr:hypothetical protein [Sinorhizobium meliloti]RVI36668.1 hypothetical protein CN202_01795 [Sinorhizobium meliloti]
MNQELTDALVEGGRQYGLDPLDVATAMSYETGGTFDPWQKGPRTQYGRHRGLIQWGEPQRQQYGIDENTSVRDQVMAAYKYLSDRGVKQGDGLLQIYAAINAGNAKNIHASDANNGGAPGTVLDKVRDQMDGHRKKAAALLGGEFKPILVTPTTDEDKLLDGDLTYRGGSTSIPNETPVFSPIAEDPSLWQTTKDAFMTEQTGVWAYREAMGPGFKFDENYRISDERLKEDFESKGIDVTPFVEHLGEVGSDEHYEHLKGVIYENHERLQRLANAGLTGTALQMANGMLDVATLPADIAIGSVAPEIVLGKKATRLHRTLVGALAGSAAGATQGAMAASVNPNKDTSDILYGAVFGFGFGGLAGSLYRNPRTMDEAATVQKLGRQLAEEAETGIQAGVQVAPGMGTSINAGSVGAAAVEPTKPFLDDAGLSFIRDGEVAQTAMRKARFTLGGKLHGSKNPLTRLAAFLVQDGVGKVGHNVNSIAVTEEVSRLTGEMMGAYHRAYNPSLDAWLTNNGYGMFDRDAGALAFNEQVTAFMRDRKFGRNDRYDTEVVKMGNKIAEINEELRRMAANPFIREGLSGRAVAGFDKIVRDPHYIMRVWDARKIADVRKSHGEAAIEALIEGSMRSANPSVPEELLKRAAKGFSKAIVKRAFGVEELLMKNVGEDNVDDLVETLVMHGGLEQADAADLIKRITTKAKDAGRDGVAKKRTLLDEEFELHGFTSEHGVAGEPLSLSSLTNNDATHLTSSYIRKMSGLIALARFRVKDPKTGEVLVDGITRDAEWSTFLRKIGNRGADMAATGAQSEAERAYDIKGLQFAYDTIKGRPAAGEGGIVDDWARTLREYNFSRVMSQAGFAQLPEFGNVIGSLGIKAALSHMPAMRRILNTDGETIRKSGFAHDMELFVPYGTENLTHNTTARFDEFSGRPNSLDRGTRQQRIEAFGRKVNRTTSVASGMAHVNEALQTMVSQGIAQKFAIMAHSGKGFSKKRLADMGLDEAMGKRIYEQFRKEGNFEYTRGLLTNQKIVRAHFDNWDDRGAREAFRNAVYRFATSTVQKNDLGNIPMWMNSTVGKTLMQFRTFVVAAYEKQTLRLLHLRDRAALMSGLFATTFAGLTYIVQEKLRSIGRSDADKQLDERLKPENIALAAVSRAGFASLAPMIMDSTVSGALFGGPVFNFRTTEQGQDALLGNPTTGLIFSDAPSALASITQPLLRGREMSQQEARALARVMPFQNFLPISMLLNSMISDLPERKPRDD